jgi:hypothetical protein
MYPSLRTAIEGERSRRELVKLEIERITRSWNEAARRMATINAPRALY